VKQFIEEEGGRVVPEVTPSLDYLLTGYRRGNKKTSEKKRADELNQKGAAIQFLSEQQFYARLLPTRDEALLLLDAGEKGRERWQRLWNYWNNAQATLDFNGLDFRGKDLSYCNFCAVTFIGADLRDTNLSGCCLRQLKDVRFDGASLRSASFSEASHCSFKKADLTEAHINPAVFTDCDFTGAVLCKVGGPYSQMTDCVFRKADLREAWLGESKLQQLDFTGADLREARLEKCDLTGAKLVGADLRNADLRNAILVHADLRKADFREAGLADADLTDAIIDGADFSGASLLGAQLGRLDLTKARGLRPELLSTGGAEGPKMRELVEVARQSQRLEVRIDLDLNGERVLLSMQSGSSSWGFSAAGYATHYRQGGSYGTPIDGQTVQAVMLNLAKKWHAGKLQLASVAVTAKKCPVPKPELKQLVASAWCEAFGVGVPSARDFDHLRQQRETTRQELLAELGCGEVEKWNARKYEQRLHAGPFRRVDLSGAKLDGVDMTHLDFEGANFEGASLKAARLGNYSRFRKAKFRGANLQNASCGIGRFSSANFAGAVMKKAHLRVCTFVNCNFQEADLTGADFGYADVRGADFSTANLNGVNWEQTRYDERTRWPRGFQPPEGLVWKGKGTDPRTA
jgi:uncharacterized protein YjbI with pentapeptide repeats